MEVKSVETIVKRPSRFTAVAKQNNSFLSAKHAGLIFLAALSSLWFAAVPIISLSVVAAFLSPQFNGSRISRWPIFVLIFTLAFINGQKWPDADLAEYYAFVDYLSGLSLKAIFFDASPFVSIRPEEFLFIGYSWFLANMSGGSRVIFTLIGTVFIYLACTINCYRAISIGDNSKAMRPPDPITAILICAALLISITFSLTAHLTRQYLAGSLFFLALLAYKPRYRRWPLFLAPVSVFVHSSAVFLLLPLALTITWSISRSLGKFCLVVLGCLAVIYPIGNQIELLQLASYFRQDGDIGIILIVLDSIAVLLAAAIVLRRGKSEPLIQSTAGMLVIFSIAFAATIANLRDIPFLFFRLYFYFEFCRAPLVALILVFGLRKMGRALSFVTFVALLGSILVCFVRANSSDWKYTDEFEPPINTLQTTNALDRMSSIEKAIL